MAEVTVELKGIAPLLKQLKNSPKIIQEEGDRAIKKSIFIIEGATVPKVPVDTGLLRAFRVTDFRPLSGVLAFQAEYAGFVHEGTIFQKSQPFLTKGVKQSQTRIEGIWKQLGDKIVKDLARK